MPHERTTHEASTGGRATVGDDKEIAMERDRRLLVGRVLREIERLWQEEASEVAYRLARVEYLRERGHEQAAEKLRGVAMDELRHLVMVTRLHAPEDVEREPRAMFAAMIDADSNAAADANEMAEVASRAGLADEAALFRQLTEDERDHVRRLKEAMAQLGQGHGPAGKE